MAKNPANLIVDNPNASVVTVTGSLVTVASVLADDIWGYDPSSPAFWPAVATLVGAVVLFFGKKRAS